MSGHNQSPGRFLPSEQTLENLKDTHALGGSEVFPFSYIQWILSIQLVLLSGPRYQSRSQSGCADQNNARGKVHHRCGCHQEVATVCPGDQTQVRVYLICRQLGRSIRNCEAVKLHILRVVVKCDIEGGELGVVADMVVTGAMEVVHNFHFQLSKQFVQFLCCEYRLWTTCTWSGTGCRGRASSGQEMNQR